MMTDERRKKFGSPDQPVMNLHLVEGGQVDGKAGTAAGGGSSRESA